MVNTSAADLLLQLKEFMTYGETLPLDSSSGAARTLDLTRLLTRINRSNTLIEQQVSDISDWPYPVRLQSAGVGLLLGAYALIILSSLLGNLFVIFVIIKMRRMHTATNVFILNVAISDVLITALNIPFSLARVLMDEWPFGSVMCRLMPFIQVVGVYSSSWTMVCIAIDRLIVTVYPLRPRMRISTGILLVIFVWLGSIAAALPYGMIHQTITTISFRTTARCVAVYPSPGPEYRRSLSLTTFILQFCIPLSCTGLCYVRIADKLWHRRKFLMASEGNGSSLSVQNADLVIRNRQRSIKMLILVVAVFAICWLPISVYHLTRDFETEATGSSHNLFTFLSLHWLAMSSVCYNPCIYCCWNSTYRNQARLLYRCLVCCLPAVKSQATHQITIRGLIVRFKISKANGDEESHLSMKGEYDQRSFNWDSVIGTREILVREGQRIYKTRQP